MKVGLSMIYEPDSLGDEFAPNGSKVTPTTICALKVWQL